MNGKSYLAFKQELLYMDFLENFQFSTTRNCKHKKTGDNLDNLYQQHPTTLRVSSCISVVTPA